MCGLPHATESDIFAATLGASCVGGRVQHTSGRETAELAAGVLGWMKHEWHTVSCEFADAVGGLVPC